MAQNPNDSRRTLLTRRRLLEAGIASAGLVAVAGPRAVRAEVGGATGDAEAGGSGPYVPSPGAAEYDFDVQRAMLDPDGQKPMPGVVVNGVLPGPEIRVKRGDLLRIRMANQLSDEPTSIH
ncbi:MAG: multicopper oxidase domain-containing protein, partial [bacterium]